MTELGVLAREVGVHERTLRRALSEGTLHAERQTPRTLAMTSSEWQYIRDRWPMISSLKKAFRTEPNVRFALLFGSAATGADTPASDVDILVDLRDSALERIVDLSAKLTSIVGRRVDLLRLHDAETDSSLLSSAVAAGRVLVDREGRWSHLLRAGRSRAARGQREQAQRARVALAGIDSLLSA